MKLSIHNKLLLLGIIMLFVFSCAGSSIGMIAHTPTMTEHSIHLTHDAGETIHNPCCDTHATTDTSPATTPLEMHHYIPSTLTTDMSTRIMLFFLILFVYARTISFQRTTQWMHTYMHRWLSFFKYHALLFLRLFSSGILHPKTW